MEISRRSLFAILAGLVCPKPKITTWRGLNILQDYNDYRFYSKGTSAWSKDHTGQWRRWVFTDDVRVEDNWSER